MVYYKLYGRRPYDSSRGVERENEVRGVDREGEENTPPVHHVVGAILFSGNIYPAMSVCS
jgi:hypothetical protein